MGSPDGIPAKKVDGHHLQVSLDTFTKNKQPHILVAPMDAVGAVFVCRKKFPDQRILLHSFADSSSPAQDYLKGLDSSEAHICICTTLCASICPQQSDMSSTHEFCHLDGLDYLYSKNVAVLARRPLHVLAPSDFFAIDVVSMPATRAPLLSADMDYTLLADERLMSNKIRAVLIAAVAEDAECVILGAFGVGSHGHPAKSVARVTRRVITEELEMWGASGIKSIVVAVDDVQPGCPTWIAFEQEFWGVKDVELDLQGHLILDDVYGI